MIGSDIFKDYNILSEARKVAENATSPLEEKVDSLTQLYGQRQTAPLNVAPQYYVTTVIPSQPYSEYSNKSSVSDMVTTSDFKFNDLPGNIRGLCWNLSKVIEINESLRKDVHQFYKTIRHEIRHRLHGISDNNPIGHYIMRALDETCEPARNIYDKVAKYFQNR